MEQSPDLIVQKIVATLSLNVSGRALSSLFRTLNDMEWTHHRQQSLRTIRLVFLTITPQLRRRSSEPAQHESWFSGH